MHGAKFPNIEAPVLNSGTGLFVKKWPGRLQALGEPDNEGERWKNEQHDRQSEREIDRPLDPAIEGIFERLLPQADEMKTIVLEMYHRMAQFFLEVADDQKSHTELVACGDKVAVRLGELGEL